MDESLLYVTANRVGIFRRGKSKAKVVSRSGIVVVVQCVGVCVERDIQHTS